MSTQALFDELDALTRADKLRALQYLAISLAREEAVELPTYEVWSPMIGDDAVDALKQYKKALSAERGHDTNE